MNRRLSYVVCEESGAFVACCLDVEVTSDGDTEAAAVAHLRDALELYFEDHGTCLADLPERRFRLGQVVVRSIR